MSSPGRTGPLQKGALVAISADGTKRSIAFQYNPDSLQIGRAHV